MSLQFIIDGYNIIHHPCFRQLIAKQIKSPKIQLIEFIRINKLCGSLKNKITAVFDGYSDLAFSKEVEKVDMGIIFSRKESADEEIKKMVEESDNPKNTVVVSDDKEIRFFVKSMGAKAMGVEEFIKGKEKSPRNNISLKPELTYTQMHKINQELKSIWLK